MWAHQKRMEGRNLSLSFDRKAKQLQHWSRYLWLKGQDDTRKSHTLVDRLGEKLLTGGVLGSGSASSVGSSLRKSCPKRQLQSLRGNRMVFFDLRESKFPAASLPQDLRGQMSWRTSRWEHIALAHPWVLEKLKGVLPWHLREWLGWGTWQKPSPESPGRKQKAGGWRSLRVYRANVIETR